MSRWIVGADEHVWPSGFVGGPLVEATERLIRVRRRAPEVQTALSCNRSSSNISARSLDAI